MKDFILNKLYEYLNEQETIKNYTKFPLNSLVKFAKKFDNYKEFEKWYSIEDNHGYYWHLTHNKDFKISDDIAPRDMSSMGSGAGYDHGSLTITGELEHWDEYYNTDPYTGKKKITRNYAVLFDASDLNPNLLKQVLRSFGNEIHLKKEYAKHLKLIGVYNIEYARKLNRKFYNMIPGSEKELYDLWTYANK